MLKKIIMLLGVSVLFGAMASAAIVLPVNSVITPDTNITNSVFNGYLYAPNYPGHSIMVYEINGENAPLYKTERSVGGAPQSIAINPSGSQIYVATDANAVRAYSANSTASYLWDFRPVGGLGQLGQIAVSPDGTRLFVVDTTAQAVRVFSIDSREELTAERISIAGEQHLFGISISPDFRFIAVTNANTMGGSGGGKVHLFKVNVDRYDDNGNVLDPATYSYVEQTSSPVDLRYPTYAVFSPDSTQLYVRVTPASTTINEDIYVFAIPQFGDTPQVISLTSGTNHIDPNNPHGEALAVSPVGHYVNNEWTDKPYLYATHYNADGKVDFYRVDMPSGDVGDDGDGKPSGNATVSPKDSLVFVPNGSMVYIIGSQNLAGTDYGDVFVCAWTGYTGSSGHLDNAIPGVPVFTHPVLADGAQMLANYSRSADWNAAPDSGGTLHYKVEYKRVGSNSWVAPEAWGYLSASTRTIAYSGDNSLTAELEPNNEYVLRVSAFDGTWHGQYAYSAQFRMAGPKIDHIEYRAKPSDAWTSGNNPCITYTVAIVGEGFGSPAADNMDTSDYNIKIDGRKVRDVVPTGGVANNGGQIYSWSPSRIEFLLPPVMKNTSRLEPGEFSINVTAFGITDTDNKTLRIRPLVSQIDPNNGPTRNEIVVYGYGFGPTQESLGVNFTGTDNRLAANVLEWALGAQGGVDQARVRVPLNAITGMVRAKVADRDSNEDVIYTVEPAVITSTSVDRDTDRSLYDGNGDGVADEDPNPAGDDFASRTWGYANSSIMVNGHDFGTDPGAANRDNLFSNVKFGDVTIPASNVWSWTDGVIELGIPRRVQNADNSYTYLDPAAYNITVTRGTASNNRSFTIYPKIDRLVVGGTTYLTQQTAQGYAGSRVEIYGYGFGAAKSDFTVKFGSNTVSSDNITYLRTQYEDRIILTAPTNLTPNTTYTITITVNNLSNNGQTIRYAVQAIGAPSISSNASFGAVEKSAPGIDPRDLDPMDPNHWVSLGDGANVYQAVRVNGSNFDPLGTGAKATVKVGNTTLTSDQVYSTTNTYVIFGTPPGVYPNYTTSSNHTLTVTAPGGSAVNTLSVAPYIDSVPAEANIGDTIRIYGTALNGAAGTSKSVTVGGVAAEGVTYGQASDTQYLELTIPVNSALVGLNKAIIATVDGHKSNTDKTINITSNEPIIEQTRVKLQGQGVGWGDDVSTVQNWAYLNDMVRIEGDNFGATAGTLKVGGVTVTPISWADTHIDFSVPRNSKLGAIDIQVTAGGVTLKHNFEVKPYLSEINPTSGHRGDTMTLSGFFTGNAAVTVNFETMPFSAASVYDTDIDLITMTVPQTIVDGRWLVSVSVNGVKSNELSFTVGSLTPVISNILVKEQGEGASWDPAINTRVVDKDWGYYNDWVRIEGSNFGATEGTIRLYDTNVNSADVYWANDHIDFKIPRDGTNPNAAIYVETADATVNQAFGVRPYISSISPAQGAAGASVTLTGYFGTRPTPGTSLVGIYFDGTAVSAYETATRGANNDTVSFTVPAGATLGSKNVFVRYPYLGGADSNTASFNVTGIIEDPRVTRIQVIHSEGDAPETREDGYIFETIVMTFNDIPATGTVAINGITLDNAVTNPASTNTRFWWDGTTNEVKILLMQTLPGGSYLEQSDLQITMTPTGFPAVTETFGLYPWIYAPSPINQGDTLTISGVGFGKGKPYNVRVYNHDTGVNVTYPANSALSGSNNTITTTGSVNVAEGDYTVNVQADDADQRSSNNESLRVNAGHINNAPADFSLTAPVDASADVTRLPQFTWQRAYDMDGDAVTYTLEIATNKEFTNPVSFTTGTTAYTLGQANMLAASTKYYWRVTASDGTAAKLCKESFWGFTTGTSTTPANKVIDDYEGGYVDPTTGYYVFPAGDARVTVAIDGANYEGKNALLMQGAELQRGAEGNDAWGAYLNNTNDLTGYNAVSFMVKTDQDVNLTFRIQDNNSRISTTHSLKIKGSANWQEKTIEVPAMTAVNGTAADIKSVRQYQVVYDGPANVQAVPVRFDLVQGTMNTPPTAPVITAPTAGANLTSTTVNFAWNASTDTDGIAGYTLVYANNEQFNKPTSVNVSGTSTTATLPVGTYYARVTAFDNRGMEKTSAVVSFNIVSAPTITGLYTADGAAALKEAIIYDSIVVKGTGFGDYAQGGRTLRVGDLLIRNADPNDGGLEIYSWTDTQIQFGVPRKAVHYTSGKVTFVEAGATAAQAVTVTTPYGSKSTNLIISPHIYGLDKTNVEPGDTLAINGTAFGGKNTTVDSVIFTNTATGTEYNYLNQTVTDRNLGTMPDGTTGLDPADTVTVTIGTDLPDGTYSVKVRENSRTSAAADQTITVERTPIPNFEIISTDVKHDQGAYVVPQDWGYVYDTVRVNGTGFGETAGTVLIDGVTVPTAGDIRVYSWTDTRIEFGIPRVNNNDYVEAHATTIVVRRADAQEVSRTFTVRPYVYWADPNHGLTGTQLVVHGTAYGASCDVSFRLNGVQQSVAIGTVTNGAEDDALRVTVPSALVAGTTYNLVVVKSGQESNSDVTFTVDFPDRPNISGIDPEFGSNESNDPFRVTITGSNLDDATGVTLDMNGTTITGTIVSATDGELVVDFNLNGAAPGRYDVVVTNPGGEGRFEDGFQILPGSVDPQYGKIIDDYDGRTIVNYSTWDGAGAPDNPVLTAELPGGFANGNETHGELAYDGADTPSAGWRGFYGHLNETKDINGYDYIGFYHQGGAGTIRVEIKTADEKTFGATLPEHYSIPLGEATWTNVQIPLSEFVEVNNEGTPIGGAMDAAHRATVVGYQATVTGQTGSTVSLDFVRAYNLGQPPVDDGDPTLPRNLMATKDGNNVVLTWDAPLDGEPGTGYNIYYGTDPSAITTLLGSVPSGTHTIPHSGAVADDNSYYYVARGAAGAQESANSNMAYMLKRALTLSPDSVSNMFWISIPYRTPYQKARDIVDDLNQGRNPGDPGTVVEIGRFDAATAITETLTWYGDVWFDTIAGDDQGFNIVAGESYYIAVTGDLDIGLAGGDNPYFAFNLVPVGTNMYWVSLPYQANYANARAIVDHINSGLNPENLIVQEIGDYNPETGVTETLTWYGDVWFDTIAGNDQGFDFTPGKGYYLSVFNSLTNWVPNRKGGK